MLEVRDLAVSYGRHRALEGVGLAVEPGEICTILGANGAGKSTLLKAIAGIVAPEPGAAIAIGGRSLVGLKPNRIVEEGVALVPEGRGIFADLTVAENLELGAYARRARRDEAATRARILALFPRLAERRGQQVRSMSGGEQQMVAIGRALMSRPAILMLDEPSLGLAPKLAQELFRALRDIAATGVGILLVEQNARQSLRIARRGYLIENGTVIGEGAAEALIHDPAVIAAYLGGAAAHPVKEAAMTLPPAPPPGAAALAARAAALADRAGRIQTAHLRATRRRAALPAAFLGRYDPTAEGRPAVPEEARVLAGQAVALAEHAAARLAAHLAERRAAAPVPAAFAGEALPGGIGHNSAAFEDGPHGIAIRPLVERAEAIHAAHVAQRRKRLTAFRPRAVPAPEAPRPDTARQTEGG